MSIMRNGYGSEWHLRSQLATDHQRITQQVLPALAAAGLPSAHTIIWHPTYLSLTAPEICGLNFLSPGSAARQEWLSWWPQTGNVQNWDAIGTVQYHSGDSEWLLVEAKANLEEVQTACKAKERGGRPLIRQRLRETQLACGIRAERDWTTGHYQYANRLALLHFLQTQQIAARLLFIYFTGDTGNDHRDCPASALPWQHKLGELKTLLGLTGRSALEQRVHTLFMPAGCHTAETQKEVPPHA